MEKEITNLLEELAKKLGTTVEHLWSILVKQSTINGFVGCLRIIIIICLSILCYIFGQYTNEQIISREWDIEAWFLVGFCFLVCLTFFLIEMHMLPTTIACFINPEYFAMSEIKGMLPSD